MLALWARKCLLWPEVLLVQRARKANSTGGAVGVVLQFTVCFGVVFLEACAPRPYSFHRLKSPSLSKL